MMEYLPRATVVIDVSISALINLKIKLTLFILDSSISYKLFSLEVRKGSSLIQMQCHYKRKPKLN
jgi:hypothetical protein